MKILYSVQATGNGHISRAVQLKPYLEKYGEVDFFLSGSNCDLNSDLVAKYKSSGISLFYSKKGGLSYSKSIFKNNYFNCIDAIRKLPVEKYDMVINDFEFITSKACLLKGVPSIQMSHQASFVSKNTPRPRGKNILSELILKYYANASQYLGFHFKEYDDFIKPPIIKQSVINATPTDNGHITVYLPSLTQKNGLNIFHKHPNIEFHWFHKDCKTEFRQRNVFIKPISNTGFTESMIASHGVLTGGGFETPAEAMYLGKKVMTAPIRGQYEQTCNAVAAEELGAERVSDIMTTNFSERLEKWINRSTPNYDIVANNVQETISKMIESYPHK